MNSKQANFFSIFYNVYDMCTIINNKTVYNIAGKY